MKNHFYISYCGNKRNEVEEIYKYIEPLITKDSVFIEPFCGSCAISYYLWLKHPKLKFKLNDGDNFLYEMFKIIRNKKKAKKLNDWYNELMEQEITKEQYKVIIKEKTIYSTFLKKKFYAMREGLYPIKHGKTTFKDFDITKCGIYDFFNNADIEYSNIDAVKFLRKYKKDKNNIIFLDPPYINTCNQSYDYQGNNNIYEYLFYHDIDNFKCHLLGIFEQNWIIKLLFKDNIIHDYQKRYDISHRKTTHLIISN
jgi:site-specific DNA-adenine methylase